MTMVASLSYAWGRMLRFLGQSTLVVIALAALLNFSPMIEPWLFPVLRDQRAVDVTRDGDTVRFFMDVYKARDCRIERVNWVVSDGDDQSPIVVMNAAGRPSTGESTYRPGHLRLGPYTATLPLYFASSGNIEISGIILYNCHAGWLVRQDFGPVTVPSEN